MVCWTRLVDWYTFWAVSRLLGTLKSLESRLPLNDTRPFFIRSSGATECHKIFATFEAMRPTFTIWLRNLKPQKRILKSLHRILRPTRIQNPKSELINTGFLEELFLKLGWTVYFVLQILKLYQTSDDLGANAFTMFLMAAIIVCRTRRLDHRERRNFPAKWFIFFLVESECSLNSKL